MSDDSIHASSENKEEVAEITAVGEEEDAEAGVTLAEVLEEEDQLEEDCDAVLGPSDDKNCSYHLGYMKRQALYACVTCTQDQKQLAGICLACSYHCHDGHELIELYTKRNFCCDCGNSKFANNKCTITSEKAAVNEKNSYNHNFKGLYCKCLRPYPDPEDTNPDDMIQCVICEDWLHSKHLGKPPPSDSDYGEMICDGCFSKNKFLLAYVNNDNNCRGSGGEAATEVVDSGCKLVSFLLQEAAANSKAADCDAVASVVTKAEACYFPEGWRSQLCRCQKCLEMYSEQKVDFLIDDEDTVDFYEQKGKQSAASKPTPTEKLMSALSSLDRVQQIEAITEYQTFSAELKEYLKKFADSKKTVRPEDITEFFDGLKQRKRQKMEEGLPHFCR